MNKKERIAANGMLLTTSMLWGSAFAFRKMALLYMGAFFFTSCRFFIASWILLAFYLIHEKTRKDKVEPGREMPIKWQVQKGMLVGLALSSGVNLQQLGLMTSDAGKCGFITALYIFFTPMICWVVFRSQIPARVWGGAGIALVGLFFISAGSNFVIVTGDILFVLTAISFAVHIITVGRYVANSNPILFCTAQTFTCSLISAVLALIFESGNAFASLIPAAVPVLYTSIFTVATGNLLHCIAQKKADPPIAAIILSLESVFGAVFAALILSERLNPLQLLGCALIFFAIILSQMERKPKNH